MRKDPQLQGAFTKGLVTTVPRHVGDYVAGYFGTYRSRAPRTKGKSSRLETIHMRNVPGRSVLIAVIVTKPLSHRCHQTIFVCYRTIFYCCHCHIVAIKPLFVFAQQGPKEGNTSLRINIAQPAMPTIRRRPQTQATLNPTASSSKIQLFLSTMKAEFFCSVSRKFPTQVTTTQLLSG